MFSKKVILGSSVRLHSLIKQANILCEDCEEQAKATEFKVEVELKSESLTQSRSCTTQVP